MGLMAERVLRDHSQPCKHAPDGYKKVWGDGFHIGHEYQWAPGHSGWCPGGREVTIDYKAANEELNYQLARGKTYSAFAIIAAGLPDREV